MNVLIVGNGGREHALAWKLKQSPKVKNIFVAPGNAGTAKIAQNINAQTTAEILDWVKNNPIDLVIIGPDNYLAEGIVDELQKLKVPAFGPTKVAAEIEWSKVFAKQLMREEGIPTANYEVFTNIEEAKTYVSNQTLPVVIKANGLALGKGVIIVYTLIEAEQALEQIMGNRVFGEAGNEVVIEEYLEGQEISLHVFCDGENFSLFSTAQDHKRIFEGDQGPNTGGMGTIVPVPGVTPEQIKEIEDLIVMPTIKALNKRGRPFKGVLYPGVMLTKTGPKVIEFNARFGDPETQSYLRLLGTDLVDIILACINGTLDKQPISWSTKSACCIVAASGGYPGDYEKGKIITGLDGIKDKEIQIFQAGTKLTGDKIVTNGGRVFGVTATGPNLKEALAKAYQALGLISFEGMQYRKDIGAKVL